MCGKELLILYKCPSGSIEFAIENVILEYSSFEYLHRAITNSALVV